MGTLVIGLGYRCAWINFLKDRLACLASNIVGALHDVPAEIRERHYSTAPNYTPVPKQGPASGKNYGIANATVLSL